jgi:amino acid transporter
MTEPPDRGDSTVQLAQTVDAGVAATPSTQEPVVWTAVTGAQPERLRRKVLGPFDIAASTMANIGPAMSFYFGFSFIAFTAGIAAPLTFIAAAVAIGFLGYTMAQFSKVLPTAGSYVVYVGKAWGPTVAIASTIVLMTGFLFAILGAIAVSGWFTADFIHHYFKSFPTSTWPWITIAFFVMGAYLMWRGIKISTRWIGAFFAFEFVVIVLVSLLALIHNAGHLTLNPFNPHYLASGFKGLGYGFPLAIFCFLGWENSVALAEETDNPRRNIPRALLVSVLLMAGTFVLMAYATVEGFHQNLNALTAAPIPFITVAQDVLVGAAFFAYLAGITSTVSCWMAAANSQTRILFNAGREGLVPKWFGYVSPKHRTPVHATLGFLCTAFVLVFAWCWWRHETPLQMFAETSTLGTIMIITVYFVFLLSLPRFYLRYYRDQFSAVKHVVIPVLGMAAIAFPMWQLIKPGQASPYSWFPYFTLAVIVVGVMYALILNARDKSLGERVGSIVADE